MKYILILSVLIVISSNSLASSRVKSEGIVISYSDKDVKVFNGVKNVRIPINYIPISVRDHLHKHLNNRISFTYPVNKKKEIFLKL